MVEDVPGADAAMRAHLPAGDPSFVKQLNQVRSRYLQEVRCLARRELRMSGVNATSLPCAMWSGISLSIRIAEAGI